MTVYIGQASHDERGQYYGGQAGNQSGTELNIREYWAKPWDYGLIRFKDGAKAQKCAEAMKMAVANKHIGYDMGGRNTSYPLAKAVNWVLSKITKNCETDCSALCGLCGIYAGAPANKIYQSGNMCYTGNIIQRFKDTGLVDIYGSSYANNASNLQNGDILVSSTHAVVVVSGAKVPGGTTSKPSQSTTATPKEAAVEELAKAVIAGKYGSGEERKKLLGSRYGEVQAKVNELLKDKPTVTASTNSATTSKIVAGTYKVLVNDLYVRSKPGLDGKVVAHYDKGEKIKGINPLITAANGYWWASYTGASGKTRYIALGSTDGKKKYLAKA